MNAIIKNNILDIHNLCKKYQVKKLYVFGSVCSKKFNNKIKKYRNYSATKTQRHKEKEEN